MTRTKTFCRAQRWLCVTLPLVFTLLFFGYLPPQFDVVLHTDNVVGEGICMTQVCSPAPFSPFYETGFYFGSELKKATVVGYHCDVQTVLLTFSDVESADLLSMDVVMFGHTVRHYDIGELAPEGDYYGLSIRPTESGEGMRFTFDDPSVGTTIGLAPPLIPAWFWAAFAALTLALAMLLACGVEYLTNRFKGLRLPLLSGGGVLLALLAGCWFCGSLPYVNYTDFLLNWLLLFALALGLNALTLPWLGTVGTMVFTLVWYVANYFVIILRNKPIMPADLKAAGTAAEVMGGYTFTPSWQMLVGAAVVLAYAAGVVVVWKKDRPAEKKPLKSRLVRRAVTLAAAVALFFVGVNTPAFKNLNSFAWDAVLLKSFHEEGMVLTYLKSALHSGVREPEGYSRAAVDAYLAEYRAAEESAPQGVRPTRIIMVMNEAFSDLRTVGLSDAIDVMPFVDSLDENTLEGSLYVSVFGGGTCNTEFEALTGNSLAFLGVGAYPYTENVTDALFSLASYFRALGYDTEAFHANEPQNWNRNMVYPNLGFDTFHSIGGYADALGEIPLLHRHPADTADYAFIEAVDAEKAGAPRFLFNVTMQNHSGYERWEDVEKAASVAEYGADLYVDTQVYLSLVQASDDAVRRLVETYRDDPEPTMIVFFGDHQPGLPAVAQSEFYTEVSSFLDWYKSKFFIWTNYETEAAHGVEVSANYLPYLILERGNFPLPPYVQLLREVHGSYPILSAMGVVDADGNLYGGVSELDGDALLRKYRYVQYANLFDEIDENWFRVP